jgi:hypothetical protein
MDSWFNEKPFDGWQDVYMDYIDISGLAETEEYSLLMTIHNLNARLVSVPQYVAVQQETIQIFNKYHPIATKNLARFGYKMPRDLNQALKFLQGVKSKEKRFRYDLQAAEDKLSKLKKPEVKDLKKSRRAFIRMLNNLGKTYKLDRDKTTVEELALMVRESIEKSAQEAMSAQAKQPTR